MHCGFSLTTHARAGVVTQSSGNHGAAIALACRLRGIAASVVVPHGAPAIKLAAIEGHGARIVRCEPNMRARDAAAATLLTETGGALIHPFDNNDVIAGQGTAALELLRECAVLDVVLTPVGGGGLLQGPRSRQGLSEGMKSGGGSGTATMRTRSSCGRPLESLDRGQHNLRLPAPTLATRTFAILPNAQTGSSG